MESKHTTQVNERPGTPVSRLCPEILTKIFSFLNIADKGRAAQVCVAWRDAAYCKSVWRGVEAKVLLDTSDTSWLESLVQRGIQRVEVTGLVRSPVRVTQGIPNIKSLKLSVCRLADYSVNEIFFKEVKSLTLLDLRECKYITDDSLRKISECAKNIEKLYLRGCKTITQFGLLYLIGLKNLKILDLGNCRQITDCDLRILRTFSSLKEIRLTACCKVSDVGLSYLAGKYSQIEVLDLSLCNISDQGLLYISQGIANLRSLSLYACTNISDEGLGYICELTNLRELYLGQNDTITDRGLASIAEHLQQLERISLINCECITENGFQKLSRNVTICDFDPYDN